MPSCSSWWTGGRLTDSAPACPSSRSRTSGGTPEPNPERVSSGRLDVANADRRRALGHIARELCERFGGGHGLHAPPDAMGPVIARAHGQLVAQRTGERLEGCEHDAAFGRAVRMPQQKPCHEASIHAAAPLDIRATPLTKESLTRLARGREAGSVEQIALGPLGPADARSYRS